MVADCYRAATFLSASSPSRHSPHSRLFSCSPLRNSTTADLPAPRRTQHSNTHNAEVCSPAALLATVWCWCWAAGQRRQRQHRAGAPGARRADADAPALLRVRNNAPQEEGAGSGQQSQSSSKGPQSTKGCCQSQSSCRREEAENPQARQQAARAQRLHAVCQGQGSQPQRRGRQGHAHQGGAGVARHDGAAKGALPERGGRVKGDDTAGARGRQEASHRLRRLPEGAVRPRRGRRAQDHRGRQADWRALAGAARGGAAAAQGGGRGGGRGVEGGTVTGLREGLTECRVGVGVEWGWT